jgi:hypothetical protein
MNRPAFALILALLVSPAGLSGQDAAGVGLSAADRQLVETYILRFYTQQDLTGASGGILEDVMLKQSILTSDSRGSETSTVILFAKSPKVCLVYLTDKAGKPTAYLQRGNDIWVYRETLRLPMKVTLSQSVSGEANIGDILGLNLLDDFICHEIRSTDASISFSFKRKAPGYPYPAVTVEADPRTGDLTSILYLGSSGDAIRRAELGPYSMVGSGHRMPAWAISNLRIRTDRVTRISYIDVKRLDIPDSFFQPNAVALGQFLKWARSYR